MNDNIDLEFMVGLLFLKIEELETDIKDLKKKSHAQGVIDERFEVIKRMDTDPLNRRVC